MAMVIVLGMALPAGAVGTEDEDAVVTAEVDEVEALPAEAGAEEDEIAVALSQDVTSKPYMSTKYGMTFYPADGYEGSEAYKDAAKKANTIYSEKSTVLGLTEAAKVVGDRAREVYVVITNIRDGNKIISYDRFEGVLPDAIEQVKQGTVKPGYKWSTIIANLQVPIVDKEAMKNTQIFDDVAPGMWYTEAINAMAQGGLLKGKGDNKFDPEATISYGEICTILTRLFDEDSRSRSFAYKPEVLSNPNFRVYTSLPNMGPVQYTAADLPSDI